MSQYVAPRPDGELPLVHTATCETCKPRTVRRWAKAEDRNAWAASHLRGGDGAPHVVTSGTARGRFPEVQL